MHTHKATSTQTSSGSFSVVQKLEALLRVFASHRSAHKLIFQPSLSTFFFLDHLVSDTKTCKKSPKAFSDHKTNKQENTGYGLQKLIFATDLHYGLFSLTNTHTHAHPVLDAHRKHLSCESSVPQKLSDTVTLQCAVSLRSRSTLSVTFASIL